MVHVDSFLSGKNRKALNEEAFGMSISYLNPFLFFLVQDGRSFSYVGFRKRRC